MVARRPRLTLLLAPLLISCSRAVREASPRPVAAAPVPRPAASDSPPRERRPVAPPELAMQLGLMPLASTGVDQWRALHPGFDGRGVLVAILDSGVDAGVLGLETTATGERKILDLRDFSGEGDVALHPVRAAGGKIAIEPGLELAGASAVRAAAADTTWYGGVLSELPFGAKPASDFNGNGSNRDRYGVVVVRGPSGWLAFVDTNGDGSLDGESPIADYLVRGETFTFSAGSAPRGRGPITAAVNLAEDSATGRPWLAICLDTSGHGTHVAGVATGHDLYGVRGFDGVAPGARIIGLKIANNARGGVSTNGSMLRAMEYATRFAQERRLPLVINLSFGIGNEQEGRAVMDSIVDAFLAAHPDVVFATSAGNDGPGTSTMGLPATARLALTVGAIYPGDFAQVQFGAPSGDVLGWWGSRGGEALKPDMVTPGMAYSSVPRWNTGEEIKLGTSMASPHAAGLAALLVSAEVQEHLPVVAARIARALTGTARRLPGESAIDQGYGVPRIEPAYQWLSAGHDATRYDVRVAEGGQPPALPALLALSAPQAAYRRNGLASAADTVQRFRIGAVAAAGRAPAARGPLRFRLTADAPWLRPAQPSVTLDSLTGSGLVEVLYDAARLARTGRYAGAVWAAPESDTAAGPAFVLANTVIVPDSLVGRVGGTVARKLPAGSAARFYFTVPPGAAGLALRLSLRDTTTLGSLFLFEPGGRPARGDAHQAFGGGEGARASLGVSANDLVPGVWEAVVQAMPGRDVIFDLKATIPPVSVTVVDSTGAAPRVQFASSAVQDTTLRVTAEELGVTTAFTAAIERGAPFRRAFQVPSWATRMVAEVRLAPEQWNQVTDLAITIFDADGAQLGNGPMNYAYHRVEALLPEDRASPFTATLELFPGFALPTPPERFDAPVRVSFVGPPRPLPLEGGSSPLTVRLPAHGSLSATLRPFAPLSAPGGPWDQLLRLGATLPPEDWVTIQRLIPVHLP